MQARSHPFAQRRQLCAVSSCRTWHRSNWNLSDGDRVAILNNVLPQWVMPMTDQSRECKRFVQAASLDGCAPESSLLLNR